MYFSREGRITGLKARTKGSRRDSSRAKRALSIDLSAEFSSFQSIFRDHGFPVAGAVDFELAHPEYQKHAARYQAWIENGSHANMEYLKRGLERRLNPKLVFPELESVFTVLKPYSPHPVGDGNIRYARYLDGPDYHEAMKDGLAAAIEAAKKTLMLPENFQYKICVDTSSVLERTWAVLSGLGWVGKNTLFIHPQWGSYVFIGVIFTNLKMQLAPKLLPDYCGNCSRCLQACPTQAFIEPHYLESQKCISYLTLEKRGPWEKAYDTQGFVAGCDVCQEVCPYNSKRVKSTPVESSASYLITNIEKLLAETESEYRTRVNGTALARIKFQDFKRNLLAVHKK
jgi:epoxyqueuosine reductase